jgi:cytochrome c5
LYFTFFRIIAMSDHESPIRTPKQLITIIVLAFVVPICLIILLAGWVSSGDKHAAGSDAYSDKAVAERIKPVASTEYKDASNAIAKTGEQVYKEVCTGCHAAGAAGAPKFGDAAAWGPRLVAGLSALTTNVIKGKGAMQARGGNPDLSDAEIQNAVAFMGNAAGAKFKETAAAAPTALVAAAPAVAGMAAVNASTAPVAAVDGGKKLYEAACVACHGAGIAGSPKFGDKAAWAPRAKLGLDALTASAIKGKNAMPPKGGSQGTDAEIKQAVAYMLAAVK